MSVAYAGARPGTVFSRSFEAPRGQWILSRLGRPPTLSDLADKTAYLMVSVRNPSFSRQLTRAFCELVDAVGGRGEVIMVDTPYAKAIIATEDDDDVRARRLANLDRVADELRRGVEKVLSQRSSPTELRSFADVESRLSAQLVAEVRAAFEREGAFREAVLDRTREVIPGSMSQARLAGFAEFLVAEIPMLIHLYYGGGPPGIVDVYPGAHPDLLWDIERGVYADDLPLTAELVDRSPGLTYVDLRVSRRRSVDSPSVGGSCRE